MTTLTAPAANAAISDVALQMIDVQVPVIKVEREAQSHDVWLMPAPFLSNAAADPYSLLVGELVRCDAVGNLETYPVYIENHCLVIEGRPVGEGIEIAARALMEAWESRGYRFPYTNWRRAPGVRSRAEALSAASTEEG